MICRVAHLSKNPTTEVARSSRMHCHHGGLPPRFLPDAKSGLRPDFKVHGAGLHCFDVRNNHEAACGEAGLPHRVAQKHG